MRFKIKDSKISVQTKAVATTATRFAAPAVAASRKVLSLEAYAFIVYEQPDTELAAHLHRGEHVAKAQHHLTDLIRDLLTKVAKTGTVRGDIPLDELASCCLHALAARGLPSKAGVRRLVSVTLAGLRPRA
jgi:hypothetical protein